MTTNNFLLYLMNPLAFVDYQTYKDFTIWDPELQLYRMPISKEELVEANILIGISLRLMLLGLKNPYKPACPTGKTTISKAASKIAFN